MTTPNEQMPQTREAQRHFSALVDSTGIKRFAGSLGISTRQINRILSGAQSNPIERLVRSLQSATPEVGDHVLDFICQEMGGHFVRHEAIDDAARAIMVKASKPKRQSAARPGAKASKEHGRT